MMGPRINPNGAAAAVTLLAAAAALAQDSDGEPVVISPEAELRWIHFFDLQSALELQWRTNYNENTQGSDTDRFVQNRARQILDLRTQGFIGHPNLLTLDLGGRFWFEQNWLRATGQDGTEFVPQTLLDWDISGLFIKETDFPFTVYTRQNTSDIDRQFGSSLQNRFSEYGARGGLRSTNAPTNLQIFYRQIRQKDLSLNQDFNIDQFTVQADGRVDFDLDNRLAWDTKYDIVDQSGNLRTPQSFNRFEGNATHTIEFGTQDLSTLRTQLRLFNETGFRDQTQVRLLPRLRLWHSPDLNSWYDYRFEFDKRIDQEQITNELTANFQYQVFDSLTLIGNAGLNLFDVPTDDFDSNEIFSRLDAQYLKQVPLGVLEANLNGFVSRTEQSDRGTSIQVTDDLNVFAPTTFIIDQRNIEASSIVITDVTGTITYTLGVDYVINAFPDAVQVQLVPGGSIVPNQLVLVDYVIGPEPGGTILNAGLGVDLRYTFREGPLRGLSFYGNLFHQDESRSMLTDDFPENDFTDLRYGIEYNFWKLYFRTERQHRDSTLSPFDAWRIEGRYNERFGRNSNLVLRALFQEIDRTEEAFRQTTATFTGQWNQRFSPNLSTSVLLQYQLSDDNVSFDSNAFEGQFDISWRYRQTEIYGQIRGSINDSNVSDNTFARLIVGIRREF